MTDWRPDVLGEGFECLDLDLGEDDEGALVATLVRSLPRPRSLWKRLLGESRMLEDVDVLYVHGWNDYFFQKPVARFFTDRGARFFALDLRKYGRSLREGQTPGYINHLNEYDLEIDLAIQTMRGESQHTPQPRTEDKEVTEDSRPAHKATPQATHSGRRLLLLGHSTGGLVLSLWADRHRGVADALMLNSPWLELQLSSVARRALAPVVGLRARFTPHELALPQLDLGFYAQAQRECCSEDELAGINLDWRTQQSPPVRAGWLNTILEGHSRINGGIDVAAPVCVLLSKRSQFGFSWDERMASADTVLEVEGIARSSLLLGSEVTVQRIDGALHDVFLSRLEVRTDAYNRMERWLLGWNASHGR